MLKICTCICWSVKPYVKTLAKLIKNVIFDEMLFLLLTLVPPQDILILGFSNTLLNEAKLTVQNISIFIFHVPGTRSSTIGWDEPSGAWSLSRNFLPSFSLLSRRSLAWKHRGFYKTRILQGQVSLLIAWDPSQYPDQFHKFQRTNPILVASILGTMSRTKGTTDENLSRKGFGGSKRSENIDLIPSVVQTVSRVLKNRHSSSVSLLPCLNSLHLWGNRVPGHLFHFFNAIGDSFRYKNVICSLDFLLFSLVLV